ncbi:MAG: ATP-binding protein [Myxococcales bacterium]
MVDVLHNRVLAGAGEMAALIRDKDWSKTPLGPPEEWSQTLRTSIGTVLNSRFPLFLWWGPQLALIYNDGYAKILGTKHPGALGTPGREVWPEIWPIIGPMLEGVFERGESTWSEDALLFLDRKGFSEESYFTFSYSPIHDEKGSVVGALATVAETTSRVLAARRLRALRELGSATASVHDVAAVCATAARVVCEDRGDVRFALLYLSGESGALSLAAAAGDQVDAPLAIAAVGAAPWPVHEAMESGASIRVGGVPGHPQTLVLPIGGSGEGRRTGVLVVGVSPMLSFDDEYAGFLELVARQIATAITNARAYEAERKRAESLAKLDAAKTVFFSNVSHEFRTPLTLILGPVDELIRSRLDPGQRHQLAILRRNAVRLLKLVNMLLDFSRIEAGRVQASYAPVDLGEITADIASVFRSTIERAGLELHVHSAPLREPVYVDRDMWEKIVLNLLSNAYKFTFAGSIDLSLREHGDRAELKVRDTGTGIPAAEIGRVFERFHRVDGARGRTQEGTGIGLALVQELVKLHGGTIRAASEEGRGSTFTVEIPFGRAHLPEHQVARTPARGTGIGASAFVEEAERWASEAPGRAVIASATPAEAARGSRPRIAVVDDNADMREYLTRLLQGRFEVETFRDGEAALRAIRADPPALVLSDVMMPGLDGFGLVRELRAREETASLPIILVSARAGEEARVEGHSSGADDYLVKPFSAKELVARVESQIALARLRHLDQQHRSELRRMFMGAPVFICLLRGPDHRFELANAAYQQLVGARDLIGRPVREALPDLSGQGFFELLDSVYQTGKPYAGKEQALRLQRAPDAAAQDVFVTFTYEPFRAASGEIDGVVVFGFDVTEIVVARRESELLAHKAQLADRRKDEFLAMLGHELRNPLAPIMSAVELMKLRGDPASEREREVIERQVAHLSQLVNDLLDVSRIAQGKIELSRRPLEIASAVSDAIEIASRLLEERMHTFRVDVPREGLTVSADPLRLAQVIANLLTNAAKYTPPRGNITISARREGGEVVVRVADDGIGMGPDLLPHVFGLFVQGARAVDRSDGGLGVGLSLVQNLVALHGGSVTAHSAGPGQGSEFVVRLPLVVAIPRADVQLDAAASRIRPGPSRRNVLVVDDNTDAAEMLAEALRAIGHDVEVAHDGVSALRRFRERPFDVGLLDLGLPVMDGFELARKLREICSGDALRLVAVTGYGQEDDRARTRAAGFDHHLVKPVELDEILQVIDELPS